MREAWRRSRPYPVLSEVVDGAGEGGVAPLGHSHVGHGLQEHRGHFCGKRRGASGGHGEFAHG